LLQDRTAYKLDTGVLEKIAKKTIFAYNKYNHELKADILPFIARLKMSSNLFFEYFYEESKQLLTEIGTLAAGLRMVDIPNEKEAADFAQCVQKFHRLIGGMASIGFEMYAPVSHNTSIMALRCADSPGYPIKDIVATIFIIVTDISMYFVSIDRVKDVEVLVPLIEKRIDACMADFHVKKVSINSQSEIDDIMKMFGHV
jgi:hypothetical protein